MGRGLWVLLGYFVLLPSAHAASFDCAKAATDVEKMICGNDALSQLDGGLSAAYKQMLDRSDDKEKVIQEQKLWMLDIRNACADPACLGQAYIARLQQVDPATCAASLSVCNRMPSHPGHYKFKRCGDLDGNNGDQE